MSKCVFTMYVTSSILGPNILLSTLFSNHVQPTLLPQYERPSFPPVLTAFKSPGRVNTNCVWGVCSYCWLIVWQNEKDG